MQKITPELIEYFNSLDELFSTVEMVAGNEDYLVIHVDRAAYDEARYYLTQYDRSRGA